MAQPEVVVAAVAGAPLLAAVVVRSAAGASPQAAGGPLLAVAVVCSAAGASPQAAGGPLLAAAVACSAAGASPQPAGGPLLAVLAKWSPLLCMAVLVVVLFSLALTSWKVVLETVEQLVP